MNESETSVRRTPAVEPVVESRLLPRITFRLLFALTTLVALLAAVARLAGQGSAVAYALTSGVLYVVGCLVVGSLLFLLARGISVLWYQSPPDAGEGSPFASDQLPPQLLPPRNPEP